MKRQLNNHQLVNVELAAGDALFFHCNLLHKSNQNRSEQARWSMICAYNAVSNKPFKQADSLYYPLEKVEDDAILNWHDVSV